MEDNSCSLRRGRAGKPAEIPCPICGNGPCEDFMSDGAPDLKVVSLHDGAPSLNDVVGRLRRLADKIEAGDYGEVAGALVVIPVAKNWPHVLGFGDVEGENHPIVQFELAKGWMVGNIVERV